MRKIILFVALAALAGCTTINATVSDQGTITIDASKQVPITNTASPSGNTVPVGATQ